MLRQYYLNVEIIVIDKVHGNPLNFRLSEAFAEYICHGTQYECNSKS